MTGKQKIDPLLWMLFAGIWMSVGALIFVAWVLKDDSQLFQVMSSGLVGGFTAAFFMRVNPKAPTPMPGDQIEHPTKVETNVKTTVSAPDPKAPAEVTTVEAVVPEEKVKGENKGGS